MAARAPRRPVAVLGVPIPEKMGQANMAPGCQASLPAAEPSLAVFLVAQAQYFENPVGPGKHPYPATQGQPTQRVKGQQGG